MTIFSNSKTFSVFNSKNISMIFIESGCKNVCDYKNPFSLLYLTNFVLDVFYDIA